ncbi:MAG TPA: hypothetical protein VFS33_08180 [Gemmatimonadales bacterium]|nr:hypothetical protein [Gemmatimonadales bacterium]
MAFVAAPPRSRFDFDARSGQYRDRASGRFVARRWIRQELDTALDRAARRARDLVGDLRERRITLEQWHLEMKRLTKSAHLFGAAAAKGGWAQMGSADYGRVGQAVRDQYKWLERFADQVRAGLPMDGRALQRAELYVLSSRSLYHRVERLEMQSRAMRYEKSELHAADHCRQCLDEAARGWVPIGEFVPVGQRECRARCRCTVSYSANREEA